MKMSIKDTPIINATPINTTGGFVVPQRPRGLIGRLLFHVSDDLHRILEPYPVHPGEESCICLSADCFLGYLGQWLYIFDYKTLVRTFRISAVSTGGAEVFWNTRDGAMNTYRSRNLGIEYRIYKPIVVEQYALGVAQNFNILKGVLERRVKDDIISREQIDWNIGKGEVGQRQSQRT